ncbi:MAG: PAS domain-containing protein [Sphingobacteriales bacterium]|nr:PAS domain-containing protein [Sphingobacteriales bacterium]
MSHRGNTAGDDGGVRQNNEPAVLITEQIPPLLAGWNKEQVCEFVNAASLDWFGKDRQTVTGNIKLPDLLGQVLFTQQLPFIQSVLAGNLHMFEAIFPVPGKPLCQALVSYIPNLEQDQVKGFYLHLADIGYLKQSRNKNLAVEKELLRAVIDIQEKERAGIAELLRDNVNQLLVYVNLMLQGKIVDEDNRKFTEDMMHTIQQAILELNNLSNRLYPSGLSMLGLIPSIKTLLSGYRKEYEADIQFSCNDASIEELKNDDKLSIFRIIQDFVSLLLINYGRLIHIGLSFHAFSLMIRIVYNNNGQAIDKSGSEFRDIQSRINYYGGKVEEFQRGENQVFITQLVFGRRD